MLMSPLLVLMVMLMSSMSFEEIFLSAVFKELVDERGNVDERVAGFGVFEEVEGLPRFGNHHAGGLDGVVNRSFVIGDADEDGEVDFLLLDDAFGELLPLRRFGPLKKVEDRKSKLSFFEVGAEGLAAFVFGADKVDDVVVDLVCGPKLHAVVVHGLAQ